MKIFIHILLLILITFNNLKSQTFYGNSLSGNSGTLGVDLNPANIAASPFRVYVDLTSSSYTFNNNFLSFKEALNFNSNNLLDSAYLTNKAKESKYSVNNNTYINLFNFMFNVGRHQGFGFGLKFRSFIQMNDFDYNSSIYQTNKNFNNFLNNGLQVDVNSNNQISSSSVFNSTVDFKNLSIITNNFFQIGLTYGRNVFEKGPHTVKAGLTIKYLIGVFGGGVQFNNNAFDVSMNNMKDIKINGRGNQEIFYNKELDASTSINNFSSSNNGFGIDLGGVYEWNPKYKDTNNLSFDRYANPYKLKFGFSITDLGAVNYNTITRIMDYTNSSITVSKDSISNLTSLQGETFKDKATNLAKKLNGKYYEETVKASISLPTLIQFNVDYHIWTKFYAAANFAINSSGIFGKYTTPIPTRLVISPRFQTKNFELSLPLSYIPTYNQFKVGAGFRIFGLYFGSDDIGFLFSNSYGLNFYFGLRLGFYKNKSTVKKYYNDKNPNIKLNQELNSFKANSIDNTKSKDTLKKEISIYKINNDRKKIDSLQNVFRKDTVSKIKSVIIDKYIQDTVINNNINKNQTDSTIKK